MPTKITIGIQGDQWFTIGQCGVSRKHAILTIPDNQNEPWILEDYNSTNGTFIREENGEMRRIQKVKISPMTFIQLGLSDVTGRSFYACHCDPRNRVTPNRYTEEFRLMRQELRRYKQDEEKANKWKNTKRLINRFAWVICFVLYCILVTCTSLVVSMEDMMELRKWVIGLSIGMIAILTFFINSKSKLSSAKKRMYSMRRCPNPNCQRRLTDTQITDGACSCGASIL